MATEETTNPAAAAEEVRLSYLDIENAVKVIDYACKEGAFKGWEVIEEVYGVRKRLASFVAYAKAVAEAAQDQQEAGEAADTAE